MKFTVGSKAASSGVHVLVLVSSESGNNFANQGHRVVLVADWTECDVLHTGSSRRGSSLTIVGCILIGVKGGTNLPLCFESIRA